MTDNEMRIAVAEALGWRWHPDRTGWVKGQVYGIPPNGEAHHWMIFPNFPNDLNACHEMEQYLERTTGMRSVNCHIQDYWLHLMRIMNPMVTLWDNGTFVGSWDNAIQVGRAEARQRCEAFLRTIGKWKGAR